MSDELTVCPALWSRTEGVTNDQIRSQFLTWMISQHYSLDTISLNSFFSSDIVKRPSELLRSLVIGESYAEDDSEAQAKEDQEVSVLIMEFSKRLHNYAEQSSIGVASKDWTMKPLMQAPYLKEMCFMMIEECVQRSERRRQRIALSSNSQALMRAE